MIKLSKLGRERSGCEEHGSGVDAFGCFCELFLSKDAGGCQSGGDDATGAVLAPMPAPWGVFIPTPLFETNAKAFVGVAGDDGAEAVLARIGDFQSQLIDIRRGVSRIGERLEGFHNCFLMAA